MHSKEVETPLLGDPIRLFLLRRHVMAMMAMVAMVIFVIFNGRHRHVSGHRRGRRNIGLRRRRALLTARTRRACLNHRALHIFVHTHQRDSGAGIAQSHKLARVFQVTAVVVVPGRTDGEAKADGLAADRA